MLKAVRTTSPLSWLRIHMRPSKPKLPKISKGRSVRRALGGHTAFNLGGNRAFRDPATMAMPDQAFTSAMAQPQGGGEASEMPPMPAPGG
jgi:hypothetical protein